MSFRGYGKGYQDGMEETVIYGLTSYPDYADGNVYITEIKITDPNVTIYGLTLNSDWETVKQVLTENEFSVTENVDLQSAEYLGSYHFYEARQVAQLLPVRRTWYNYALMPLQAIGYVADVPLSIVTMTLTLPFAGVLSPHLDYTTTNQPERSDTYIEPWHRYDN